MVSGMNLQAFCVRIPSQKRRVDYKSKFHSGIYERKKLAGAFSPGLISGGFVASFFCPPCFSLLPVCFLCFLRLSFVDFPNIIHTSPTVELTEGIHATKTMWEESKKMIDRAEKIG